MRKNDSKKVLTVHYYCIIIKEIIVLWGKSYKKNKEKEK